MVITQADSRETQQRVRQNALDNGVRLLTSHSVVTGISVSYILVT